MKRAIIHSISILALAGLGWAIQLTESHPLAAPWSERGAESALLGFWGWLPAVMGCLGLASCFLACFAAARNKTSWLPVLLVLPCIGLVSSAVGFYAEVRQMMSAFTAADILQGEYYSALEWLSGRAYFAQTVLVRGAVWSGLTLAGAAIAAGCTPTRNEERKFSALLAWPTITGFLVLLALGVYVAGYAGVFRNIGAGSIVWGRVLRSAHSLVDPDALLIQLPLLAAALILAGMPLALMNLRPGVRDFRGTVAPGLATARATAATATVGGGLFLGLAVWLSGSAGGMQWTYWALSTSYGAKQHMLSTLSGYSYFSTYAAGLPTCLALLAVSVVVATPLLLTALRSWPRWLVPMGLFVTTVIAYTGIRAAAAPHVSEELTPHCSQRCTELDRIAAMLTMARYQDNTQIIRDRCGRDFEAAQTETMTIARYESDRCGEVTVTLRLEQQKVLVNRVTIAPVLPSPPSCDPALLGQINATLAERVQEAQAVAARNPKNPFTGRLMVLPDASTRAEVIDCILAEAFSVGFLDLSIVVARPDSRFPLLLRTVGLHADPKMLPPPGTPTWNLHLSPSQAVLTSPTGEAWTAPSAGLLVPDAREALSYLRGSPMLWVQRSDDLTLQDDLDARAALTGMGLFVEAWSLPLGVEPEVWVPPDKPNHPAVP